MSSAVAPQLREEAPPGYDAVLHGVCLMDLLQMMHWGRRSLVLLVDQGARVGTVTFVDGEIADACLGSHSGKAALRRLLRDSTGTVSTHQVQKVERTMNESFEACLLDCLRQIDEDGVPSSRGEKKPLECEAPRQPERRSQVWETRPPPRVLVDRLAKRLAKAWRLEWSSVATFDEPGAYESRLMSAERTLDSERRVRQSVQRDRGVGLVAWKFGVVVVEARFPSDTERQEFCAAFPRFASQLLQELEQQDQGLVL